LFLNTQPIVQLFYVTAVIYKTASMLGYKLRPPYDKTIPLGSSVWSLDGKLHNETTLDEK